jgi:EAL domain-containing protein (putative c-di-GMP-specific phosphodiesterase class I)
MAVNVSAHQWMSSGFVAMVKSILIAANTRPKELCPEVTESAPWRTPSMPSRYCQTSSSSEYT